MTDYKEILNKPEYDFINTNEHLVSPIRSDFRLSVIPLISISLLSIFVPYA